MSLTASPTSVPANGSSTLTWSVQNSLECQASGGWSGSKAASGTVTVGPLTVSTVYLLTCRGFGGITTEAVTVVVDSQPPPPAPTVSLAASPTSVGLNESTTLTWSSTDADDCQAFDGWSGLKATSGSEVTSPLTATTTFTLVCNGAGGSTSSSVAVTVGAPPPPPTPTVSLTANPLQVAYNGQSTLAWSSTDATSCVASGDWVGPKSTSGSEMVGPLTAASTFILVCSGAGGDASQLVTVTVQPPPNQPPVANDDTTTTPQGATVIIDVLANDTDADAGDTLTVSAVTPPANGSVVNNNTNVTYTPNAGFSGSDTFTYTATDGTAASNSATVTVTVQPAPGPKAGDNDGDGMADAWESTFGLNPSDATDAAQDADADGFSNLEEFQAGTDPGNPSDGKPVLQTVLRGPYLQQGTATSIIVRWRTDHLATSGVYYGTASGALTAETTSQTLTTEHELLINNLQPDTRYYYKIGNYYSALVTGESAPSFSTAPIPGTAKPTRIWVIGDSGTANSNARAVRDAYKTYTGAQKTDLWLMLGDNAYPDGTDSEYQAAVFNMYPELLREVSLWPTLGNHDGHSVPSGTQTGPYYDIFTLPTMAEAGGVASGTEAYYSFDYANIHFVCLESYDTDRSPSGTMMTWLQNDLAATDKPWVIAFWHHPPYTKGSHDSDTESALVDMRQNALPILESYGVDLVLSGHSHSYERSYLIDGHYGTSDTFTAAMKIDGGDGNELGNGAYAKPGVPGTPNQGAVYAVAGSSGKTSSGPLNHPAMFISLQRLGSMVLDVSGNRLDAIFLDDVGSVQDRFTVIKGP